MYECFVVLRKYVNCENMLTKKIAVCWFHRKSECSPPPWKLLCKGVQIEEMKRKQNHFSWRVSKFDSVLSETTSYQRWGFNSGWNGARSPRFHACLYRAAWTYLFSFLLKAFRAVGFFISPHLLPAQTRISRMNTLHTIELQTVVVENSDGMRCARLSFKKYRVDISLLYK